MNIRQPYSADFQPVMTAAVSSLGMSLPMARKIARDSADQAIAPKAVLARGATRENSKLMTSPATPEDVCNCVFRYPSQSSWSGTVPTAPAAPSFSASRYGPDARAIADLKPQLQRHLPVWSGVAWSRYTQSGTRGKSRCEFLKLRRSHVSPSVALRPAATRRWNRACSVQAPVQARPLSRVAMPSQARSLAQAPMCFTARPIRNAATKLTSASSQAHPMIVTTRAPRVFGGFLLPRSMSGPARLNTGPRRARKEGTLDVQ